MSERSIHLNRELQALAEKDSRVDHYEPRFLGQGGEQIVFEMPHHPSVVMKVNTRYLADSLRNLAEGNWELGKPLPDFVQEMFSGRIQDEQRNMQHIKDVFGKDAVLSERLFVQTVPITRGLVKEAIPDRPELISIVPEGGADVWTVVRIQERFPKEATGEDVVDLNFNYVEKEEWNPDDYAAITQELLLGNGEHAEKYLERAWGERFLDAKRAQENPEFLGALRTFVENAVRYTHESGKILDLAGTHNAFLFPKEGYWRLLLPDVDYPLRSVTIKEAEEAIERLELTSSSLGEDAVSVGNALNYARFINALAVYSGSSARVRFRLGDHPAETLKTIYRLSGQILRT